MKLLIRLVIANILLLCSVYLTACGYLTAERIEIETTIVEEQDDKEKAGMAEKMSEKFAEQLGCGERTAASVYEIILDAGVPDICEISKIEDGAYTILKATDFANRDYYVFIGIGYFVEEIRTESVDGPIIYSAIQ